MYNMFGSDQASYHLSLINRAQIFGPRPIHSGLGWLSPRTPHPYFSPFACPMVHFIDFL